MAFIPIIIIIAIIGFSFAGNILKDMHLGLPNLNLGLGFGNATQEKKSPAKTPTQSQKTYQPTSPRAPPFSLETTILKPKNGELFSDTNSVLFEFSGTAYPTQTGQITFETKIIGIDTDWQATSSNYRRVDFPSGPKQYTFYVRSKLNDVADTTPSLVNVRINTSPYFQKIRIGSFQATTTRPARITLNTSFGSETQINITGWRFKSTWSGEFTIPLGVSKFHSTPISTPTENIQIQRSDAIYLFGDTNPFGRGVNFRPNACFGYLNQYYQNLPESFSCSQYRPSVAEIKNLSPACQEFILTKVDYGSCKLPNYANDPGIAGNQECVAYLTSANGGFNYEGCYQKYSQDQNFFSNKWYIYMDTAFGNPLHDSVTLYDKNGLVVDTYTY